MSGPASQTQRTLQALELHNLSALCLVARVDRQRVKNAKRGQIKALTPEECEKLLATAKEALS